MRLAAWFLAAALCGAPLARAQDAYTSALSRFATALRALREGDEAAAAGLKGAADELCTLHGRCDPRDVAAWYAALPVEARRQGVRDEVRYLELWQRVRDAGASGVSGAEWAREREAIVEQLAGLAREAAERPDFVPAAQALALLARIEVERYESDATLDARARTEIGRRAQADATRSLELFARAGQSTPRLEPEYLLARLALARGDVSVARTGFDTLLTRAERVRRDDFREHALQGQMALARLEGDVREEERLLVELASFRDPRESWPLARDWAARLIHHDHAEEALVFLEQNAPPPGSHALDVQEWNLLVGSASLRAGQLDGARERFGLVAGDSPSEASLLAFASLALEEGRAEEVLELLDEPLRGSLSPLGRERALTLVGAAELKLGDAQAAREHLSLAFDAALDREGEQRSLARGTTLQRLGSVIGEGLGLESVAKLAQAHLACGDPLGAAAVIGDAHARSLRRGAEFTVDVACVKRWAASTELGLLTWVVGADTTVVAYVDPRGRARAETLAGGRRELELAVRRRREAALAPAGPATRVPQLGDELLRRLVPPTLLAELTTCRVGAGSEPRLLLCAHGPLEALPFELLSRALAGDDGAVLVLPGLPAPEPGPAPLAADLATWTLAGAPLESSLPRLAAAENELLALSRLRPGSTLVTGATFTRAALLDACRSSAPLHLATHLIDGCDRWRAFGPAAIVTSDRLALCADELAAARPKLPLVVLSACWSGGGERVDAEGLFGLARAFLSSGTRNLVVTSWPVEDTAAARFGELFHRELALVSSPSRAAARARRALAATGAVPADWAGFRVVGRD
ncbi:MAG: CHAT domain-containing protein [Planctomycetota bacterium]|nr:CHAT domain-containing protein [Planctomycetota bacterium]